MGKGNNSPKEMLLRSVVYTMHALHEHGHFGRTLKWRHPTSIPCSEGWFVDCLKCITVANCRKLCAGVPPSQQVRLRWANQVEALPPAYQAAGAGVLNDILGPSGDQSSGAGGF